MAETHDIEGLDPIRSTSGTALTLIAGAAKHWETTAKTAYADGHSEGMLAGRELERPRARAQGAVCMAVFSVVANIVIHFILH